MKNQQHTEHNTSSLCNDLTNCRRKEERRKEFQEGYVRIDGIGWYCRRFKRRRKDDSPQRL